MARERYIQFFEIRPILTIFGGFLTGRLGKN
jgi:hypothetical protein